MPFDGNSKLNWKVCASMVLRRPLVASRVSPESRVRAPHGGHHTTVSSVGQSTGLMRSLFRGLVVCSLVPGVGAVGGTTGHEGEAGRHHGWPSALHCARVGLRRHCRLPCCGHGRRRWHAPAAAELCMPCSSCMPNPACARPQRCVAGPAADEHATHSTTPCSGGRTTRRPASGGSGPAAAATRWAAALLLALYPFSVAASPPLCLS